MCTTRRPPSSRSGLLLATLRGFPGFVRAQDEGRWAYEFRTSLADSTVLIVGAGSIATALLRRLLPFEVDVVRVGTRFREDDDGVVHGIDELPDLLPGADAVVLLVPLTDTTRHLVDAKFLAAMKDGAVLVNVARGPIVDTDALLAETRVGPAAGRARRHRPRAAAGRPSAVALARGADQPARGRGHLGDASAHARAAARAAHPVRRRGAAGQRGGRSRRLRAGGATRVVVRAPGGLPSGAVVAQRMPWVTAWPAARTRVASAIGR